MGANRGVQKFVMDQLLEHVQLGTPALVDSGKAEGWSPRQIRGAIAGLYAKGMLLRAGCGIYRINLNAKPPEPKKKARVGRPRGAGNAKSPSYAKLENRQGVLRATTSVCGRGPIPIEAPRRDQQLAKQAGPSLAKAIASLCDRYKILDVPFATELAALCVDVREGRIK